LTLGRLTTRAIEAPLRGEAEWERLVTLTLLPSATPSRFNENLRSLT